MYNSEIRESQMVALSDKVNRKNYGRYLMRVRLGKIRSFSGDIIDFDFPVTALIGPNGGGKSTILGAAGCAYKQIKPSLFFPKSSIGDNSMSDWVVEYEAIDRDISSRSEVRRSSRFRQLRWVRGDVLSRNVLYFGINRTVPASEKPVFKKLMKPSYSHSEPERDISDSVKLQVEKILGKSVDSFRVTNFGVNDKFYIGGDGSTQYSEFHFGAGEASIIRMVSSIELAETNALVLIEEIENGLHPIATQRLVEYFIDVAERKSCQIIFTTHSDYALVPLPSEAIWSAVDGNVQQGKLSVYTLRAISGRIDKKIAIFVEDEFAKHWMEAILREKIGLRFEEVEVHAVKGDGNAVRIHKSHITNPAISTQSLCFVDGDSRQTDCEDEGIHKLPGTQPELTVFDTVMQSLDSNIAILTVACQRAPESQEQMRQAIEEVHRTNRDPHLLFSQIGIKIGFVPEVIIRGAFLSLWIRENSDLADSIVSPINTLLDPAEQSH
ncbi:MAG TPA: hypothetical protein ENK84_01015 [Desulfobulbus sp.]|nr:hypothetical protein [Desulfobulbus sp.]